MHTDFGMTSTTDEIVRYWKEKAKNTGIGEISNIEIPYFTLFDVEDNYQDYDKPSIKIMTSVCDFKCCKEQGLDVSVCANHKYSSELPKKVNLGRNLILSSQSSIALLRSVIPVVKINTG